MTWFFIVCLLLKRHERVNHTLCTSALVHEAYLHLSSQQRSQWKNRSHFYAIASMTMRRVLINYARDRVAAKRGGHQFPESLDENSCLPQNIDYEELLTVN
ncbi:MAG: ECF-type sigma factor, partial [bacterium]